MNNLLAAVAAIIVIIAIVIIYLYVTSPSTTTNPSNNSTSVESGLTITPSVNSTPTTSVSTNGASNQNLGGQGKIFISQAQAQIISPTTSQTNVSTGYNVSIYNATSPTNISTYLSGAEISSNQTIDNGFAANITAAWWVTYLTYGRSPAGAENSSVVIETVYQSKSPQSSYKMLYEFGMPPELGTYNISNATLNGITYSYASGEDKVLGNAPRDYFIAKTGSYVITFDIIGVWSNAATLAGMVSNDTA